MITSPVAIGILAGAALLLFGPKHIPALAKSFGLGVRNFRAGLKGKSKIESAESKEIVEIESSDSMPDKEKS